MAKIKSFGIEVYVDGDAVGGLTDVSISGTDVSFIDLTTHDSSGEYKEFVGGLLEGGTLELTGKFNIEDDGQLALQAGPGDEATFYVIKSDNSGFAFTGIIGGYSTSNPLDDAVEFTATVKITGLVATVYPTMTVTGTLTDGSDDVGFSPADLNGIVDGKPAYGTVVGWSISGYWIINDIDTGAEWRSTSDTLTPDLATGWTPVSPATGTPTVTGA